MTTYRERRERRAERLGEWAESRDRKATDAQERVDSIARHIPFGQPILVGHHSERRARRDQEKMWNGMAASVEHSRKAESMRSRARNIERQLDESIYSDDEDAIERLEERIAGLEAQRDKIKAHNKAMRKKGACDHPADCDCRTHYPRECTNCPNHPFPSYHLSNFSANIKRNRDRLEQLKREAAAREAPVVSEVSGRIDGMRASLRTTESRTEVHFDAKPSADIRAGLKSHGFRWDRVEECWFVRASYGPGAEYAATLIEEEAA